MANSRNAHDFILSASALSSPCLDLSRKGITHLPSEFPGCSKLECLYLEGNQLCVLPESLFTSCPNLRWLDLRNNKLVSLSPSIVHLRCLRTLLLENNQLTTLPPQLGRLRHLSGLSLSQNPLENPPQYAVKNGTKAVLQYLREQLKEWEEGREGEEDSDGSLVLPSVSTTHTSSHNSHIPPIHGTVTVPLHADAPPASPALPVWGPLMKSATLHIPRQRLGLPCEDTPSPPHSRHRERRKQRTKPKRGEVMKDPPSHTQEEQQEITTAIERQKSHQCLENWREETRKLQRLMVHRPLHHHAPLTAPFGTEEDNRTHKDECSPAQLRLKAMERLCHSRQGSTDSVRDARERKVTERVHKHTLELREKRQQAGLIPYPSAELLEAENQLAKVMTKCEDLRGSAREYRLTAFTGELPLGH